MLALISGFVYWCLNMGVSIPIWIVTSKKWAVIKTKLDIDIKLSKMAVLSILYADQRNIVRVIEN